MKKLLVRLILALVVIVIVVGVVGYIWMDSIAKAAVQRGGSYAMDVPTTVESVSIHPFSGRLQVKKLTVGNPEGYKTSHMMSTGTFDVEVSVGSLISKPVEVKALGLDGLDFNLEQGSGGTNVGKILDNIKQKFGGGEEQPEEKTKEGTKYKVGKVSIRNVVAHITLISGVPATVKVPTIEVEDLTKGEAVTMPQLVSRLVPIIVQAVLASAKDILPTELLNNLQGDVSAIAKQLGGQAQEMIKGVQKNVGEALKGIVPKDANALGGNLKKGVEDTMGKILGGGSKDANDANKPAGSGGGLLKGILGK